MENFERFFIGNKVSQNFVRFLCPKSVKERGKNRREKYDFGTKRNGLQANYFFKWNCLLMYYIVLFLLLSTCLC